MDAPFSVLLCLGVVSSAAAHIARKLLSRWYAVTALSSLALVVALVAGLSWLGGEGDILKDLVGMTLFLAWPVILTFGAVRLTSRRGSAPSPLVLALLIGPLCFLAGFGLAAVVGVSLGLL